MPSDTADKLLSLLSILIHPDTTNKRIEELWTANRQGCEYRLPNLRSDDVKIDLRLMYMNTNDAGVANHFVGALLYRLGEEKYALTDMVLQGWENAAAALIAFANPREVTTPDALLVKVLEALGTDKSGLRNLPLWLQILLAKAFTLPTEVLSNPDYDLQQTTATAIDIDSLKRLVAVLEQGQAEKPAVENVELACLIKVHRKNAAKEYSGQTAKAMIGDNRMAKALRLADNPSFNYYNQFPPEYLVTIAKAYAESQDGIAAKPMAAAYCHAYLYSQDNADSEAKAFLDGVFSQGIEGFPANKSARERFRAITTPETRFDDAGGAADGEASPATEQGGDDVAAVAEGIIAKISYQGAVEQLQRLKDKPLTLEMALQVVALPKEFINAKSCEPGIAFNQINGFVVFQGGKAQRIFTTHLQNVWKNKFSAETTDQALLAVYSSAVKKVDDFFAVLNAIYLEQYKNENGSDQFPSLLKRVEVLSQTLITADNVFEELPKALSLLQDIQSLHSRINHFVQDIMSMLPDLESTMNDVDKMLAPTSFLIQRFHTLKETIVSRLEACHRKCEDYETLIAKAQQNQYQQVLSFAAEVDIDIDQMGPEGISLTAENDKFIKDTLDGLAILFPPVEQAAHNNIQDLFVRATLATNQHFARISLTDPATAMQSIARYHNGIQCRYTDIKKFIEQEQAAKEQCLAYGKRERKRDMTWGSTLHDHIAAEAEVVMRGLLQESPSEPWEGLLSGIRNQFQFSDDVLIDDNEKKALLSYLQVRGVERQDLSPAKTLAYQATAILNLSEEYKAYCDIKRLLAENNFYPDGADNAYTQSCAAVSNEVRDDLTFDGKRPGYFKDWLEQLQQDQATEAAAEAEIKNILETARQALQYAEGPCPLQQQLDQLVMFMTFLQSKDSIENFINIEKDCKYFLDLTYALYGYASVNDIAGATYRDKFTALPAAAATLKDELDQLEQDPAAETASQGSGDSSEEDRRAARLEQERVAKDKMMAFRGSYAEWAKKLFPQECNFNDAGELINKTYCALSKHCDLQVNQRFENLCAELQEGSLIANYKRSHQLLSASADRLQVIQALVSFKDTLLANNQYSKFEKYIILLGALITFEQETRDKHVNGVAGDNGAFRRFIKRHLTTSGLVSTLDGVIANSCPDVVRHGFFATAPNSQHQLLFEAKSFYDAVKDAVLPVQQDEHEADPAAARPAAAAASS